MINRLVVENLKHRAVRTLAGAFAIAVQVAMLLTLVGLSRGMVADTQARARGVGADVVVRPPGSTVFSFSGNFPASALSTVRDQNGVALATGTLVYPLGGTESATGIDMAEFNAMSGGFRYLEGHAFRGPDEILVDSIYARAHDAGVGKGIELMNRTWRVAGVVEPGKMSRIFTQLAPLQDLTANNGRLSAIWVKLVDPAKADAAVAAIKEKLPGFQVFSMPELLSQITETNVPMLRQFTGVVIGIGVLFSFVTVFLSTYTAVLERTREIGILKSLGASPGFILGVLLRETVVLAIMGSALGILLTYGTRWLMSVLAPMMIQVIVPDWWPIATAISVSGSLGGALYPGLRAARQDVLDALAYE